jgi:phosphohistidine swiveling domain-containing protein
MSDSPADGFFLEIADDPRVGGKARSLARLRAAGLPTPDGFVVVDAVFASLLAAGAEGAGSASAGGGAAARVVSPSAGAALARAAFPGGFSPALAARLRVLGGSLFSVRSSFAHEDDAQAVAAGIYQSRTAVPAADVERAVREVFASAVAPAAAAYASARGRALAETPVSVLVHRYHAGDRSGGAAWDPAFVDRPVVIDAREGPLSQGVRARLDAAVRGLAAKHGAVETEWVADGDAVTFLQMRPYRAPPARPPWPGARELPPGLPWRWDASHNPLPLSAAQSGLVALVDARCRTGFRQHVAGGYLFWAPGGPAVPIGLAPADLPDEVDRLAREVDSALTALGDPPALEPALQTFVSFYERLYGVVRPAIDQARRALLDLLRAGQVPADALLPLLLAGVESRASERRRRADAIASTSTDAARQEALADYLSRFGDESPVWDVASPTYREHPQAIVARLTAQPPAPSAAAIGATAGASEPPAAPAHPDGAATAERIRAGLPAALAASWEPTLAQARAAVAAGEDDDWIYARLQAAVRRALLHLGRQLAAAGHLARADDVFQLPLQIARNLAAGQPAASDLRVRAAAGRAAFAAALRAPPPLSPSPSTSPSTGPSGVIPGAGLRGHGTGGRAVGRVHHHDPASAPPPDAVLVATTLLPTELPLLQVAALVTETGGPLDHVATQARERGLPAVVGAAGALERLPPGELVLVDADTGLVIPCAPPGVLPTR